MIFQWPLALFGALVLPALAALYVWVLRRPPRRPVRYTQVGLVAQAAEAAGRWRRHLAPALLALSVLAVILALARPVAPMPVPATQNTVVLSIDVSRSMLADDLTP